MSSSKDRDGGSSKKSSSSSKRDKDDDVVFTKSSSSSTHKSSSSSSSSSHKEHKDRDGGASSSSSSKDDRSHRDRDRDRDRDPPSSSSSSSSSRRDSSAPLPSSTSSNSLRGSSAGGRDATSPSGSSTAAKDGTTPSSSTSGPSSSSSSSGRKPAAAAADEPEPSPRSAPGSRPTTADILRTSEATSGSGWGFGKDSNDVTTDAAELARLRKENDELTQKVKRREKKIDSLVKDIEELEKKAAATPAASSSSSSASSAASAAELDGLKKQLEAEKKARTDTESKLNKSIDDQQKRIADLTKKEREMAAVVEALSGQAGDRETADKRVKELVAQVQQLKEELRKSESESSRYSTDLASERTRLTNNARDLEDKVAKLQQEARDAKKQADDAKKQADDSDAKAARATKELEQVKRDLIASRQASTAVEALSIELGRAKDDNKLLTERVTSLTASLKDAQQRQDSQDASASGEADKLRSQLADLRAELARAEARIADLTKQLDAKTSGADAEAKRSIDRLRDDNQELERKLKKATDDAKRQQSDADASAASAAAAATKAQDEQRRRIDELTRANDDLKARLRTKDDELDESKRAAETAAATAAAAAAAAAVAGPAQSAADTGRLRELEEERDRLQKELRRAKEDADEQRQDLEGKVRRLKQERNGLEEQLESKAGAEIGAELESKLKQNEEELERVQDELRDKAKRLKRTKEQLEEVQGELQQARQHQEEADERHKSELERLEEQLAEAKKAASAAAAAAATTTTTSTTSRAGKRSSSKDSSSSSDEDKNSDDDDDDDDRNRRRRNGRNNNNKKKDDDDDDHDNDDDDDDGDGDDKASAGRKAIARERQELLEMKRELEEASAIQTAFAMGGGADFDRSGQPQAIVRFVAALREWRAFDEPGRIGLYKKVVDVVHTGTERAGAEEPALVHWLSCTVALIHLLQDEDEIRLTAPDPAASGVEMPVPEVPDLDDEGAVRWFGSSLRRLASEVYLRLFHVARDKLEPMIVPAIVDKHNTQNQERIVPITIKTVRRLLSDLVKLLRDNRIPEPLVVQLVHQILYWIDATSFNTLLKRSELCCSGNGFELKLNLSELEDWLNGNNFPLKQARTFIGHALDAATLLVIDKSIFGDPDLIKSTFPSLNILQVKHLLNQFKPDQYSPEPIPNQAKAKVYKTYLHAPNKASLLLELDQDWLLPNRPKPS